jgi:hypothetical protein
MEYSQIAVEYGLQRNAREMVLELNAYRITAPEAQWSELTSTRAQELPARLRIEVEPPECLDIRLRGEAEGFVINGITSVAHRSVSPLIPPSSTTPGCLHR